MVSSVVRNVVLDNNTNGIYSVPTMTTNPQLPHDAADFRSEAEIETAEKDATIRRLKDMVAARNARCAELRVHLERVVEAFGPLADGTHARVLAGAHKALGWDYDADALNEYGEGF